ncbi:MAG: hypothetical protein IPH28_25640 [Cytophagaceae bacterium]|nr:hypothetical protein [Cytophagaceae bacterium]MBK9936516.1 hypothetical protein [Cytophagaceae bacterium]
MSRIVARTLNHNKVIEEWMKNIQDYNGYNFSKPTLSMTKKSGLIA